MASLILIAAGGLGREVLAAVEARGQDRVLGFLDDDGAVHGTRVGGVEVRGPIDSADRYREASFVICAGSGRARAAIVERLSARGIHGGRYATVLDPTVRVHSSCRVGPGSVLLAHTVLTADVSVGSHVVTMPHVTLTHDNQVGDYVTLCAQVTLGGEVRVGEKAYLGMAASVRERLTVGPRSTLGMGAVLLEDLPADQTWVGCPARPLHHNVTHLRNRSA
ncbi:NeuD/PglB/VioB family sugar acetyltransferase [uncultured Friedmanniella sp.]|uniref:NeuD/PglB/VioB family sugar acetyltransferase n=1 Tax=uncultured Friedmanniella sp. TaxID=335381 RepID=UPI0035CBC4A5